MLLSKRKPRQLRVYSHIIGHTQALREEARMEQMVGAAPTRRVSAVVCTAADRKGPFG